MGRCHWQFHDAVAFRLSHVVLYRRRAEYHG